MKNMIAIVLLCLPLVAFAQDQKPEQKPFTLRNHLLEQLKATHTNKDWFVPANIAVQGVTPEQAVGPMATEITRSASWPTIWRSGMLRNSPN
jgi:hypothetical protein